MSTSVAACSFCGKDGKQRTALKRCSICKHAWYCGAECQKAGWKKHKKKCAPPLSFHDVLDIVADALEIDDWRGVLEWEARAEQLMEGMTDARSYEVQESLLAIFTSAHSLGYEATGKKLHARSICLLRERRVELLGKLERFRDQGEMMCMAAEQLNFLHKDKEAEGWLKRARDVGAAHGFFSVECHACRGLGTMLIQDGRVEEGVDLLRNALIAAGLTEESTIDERFVLEPLIRILFKTGAIDEAYQTLNTKH